MDKHYYQNKLESEKKELEEALSKLGRLNPANAHDWQVKPAGEEETEFRDEVADQLEEMDEREATEVELEQRYKRVTHALDRIAAGTYGTCEISGEPIETDRLEANPAARTCKKHLNEEDHLRLS